MRSSGSVEQPLAEGTGTKDLDDCPRNGPMTPAVLAATVQRTYTTSDAAILLLLPAEIIAASTDLLTRLG